MAFESKFAECKIAAAEEDEGVAEGKAGELGADPVAIKGEDGWVLPGAGEDASVIARAAQWFGKKGKLKLLTDFARDNWEVFSDEVDRCEADDDGTGFRMEYDDCHKRFLALFEVELENFVEEEGFTLDDFQREAEEVRSGKSLTLFENEDGEHRSFLDALLSSLDFEHFMGQMVKMARNQSRRGSKGSRSKK